MKVNEFKTCWLMSRFIFNMFKRSYLMCKWKNKKKIYNRDRWLKDGVPFDDQLYMNSLLWNEY